MKREEIEDIAKRKIKINRVPERVKKEFIQFANKEFCGDYGMALREVWEKYKEFVMLYENMNFKLDEIMTLLSNDSEGEEQEQGKKIKLLSGKKLNVSDKKSKGGSKNG